MPEMPNVLILRFARMGALMAMLLVPSLTMAQTINYTILSFEGREGNAVTNLQGFPVGASECSANPNLVLQFTNIPTDARYLDFWRSSEGEDCSLATSREQDVQVDCDYITLNEDEAQTGGRAQEQVTIPLASLVDCSSTTGGLTNVYVLATQSQQFRGEITAFSLIPIQVDFSAPDAPAEIKGSDGATSFGDSAIPISWKAAENQEDLDSYTVYKAGSCDAPDVANATEVKSVDPSSNSTTISGESLGLDYDGSAAIFITLTDRAGNTSEPSSVVCVTRVQVAGFCDVHGECEDCSVGRMGTSPTPLLGALFALGMLAWRRRQ